MRSGGSEFSKLLEKRISDYYVELKYEEVQQLRQRPHPHEFTMYYDA